MDVRLKLCIDYCSWLIFKVFQQVYRTLCRLLPYTHTHSQNFTLCQWPIKFDRQFNYTWRPLSMFLFMYLLVDTQLVFFLSFFVLRCSSLCTHNINGLNHPSVGTIERKRRTYLFFSCIFRTITLNYKMLTNVRKSCENFEWPFVIKTFCSRSFYLSIYIIHSLSVRSYLFSISFPLFVSFIHSFVLLQKHSPALTLLRSFTNCFYFCVLCACSNKERRNHSVWMGTSYFVTIIFRQCTKTVKITVVFLNRFHSRPALPWENLLCANGSIKQRCQ